MQPSKKKSSLKNYYTLLLEIGLIISLLIFLALMKLPIQGTSGEELAFNNQEEIVEIEEVERTKQEEEPPSPPQPQVPVEVPNNEIIEDEILNIDAELNLNDEIDLPPPPVSKEEEDKEEENFFVAVEEMPELIGGIQALQQKIKYPEKAQKANIEGRVIIQFIVNKQGGVDNPRVIRGIGGGCDEEALRVVKQAKFKPGRQRGEPVRVQYSLPIIFKLRT